MKYDQTYSIKETRERLSSLIEEVAIAKKRFIITKFGKPKAIVSPVLDQANARKKQTEDILATAGAWKHRKDIKNSAKWVAELRHRMSSRFHEASS